MMEFVGRAVADVGALLGGAMVVLGDKLGLYRAMAGTGSITSAELAARTVHDMGDPAGACAHARAQLAPGGTLMLIEPFAADDITGNLNPVGAAYYGFSTLLCTPSSLSQEAGTALGAQAGEARLREIVTSAGFATLRRVAETPFNIVLEARA
jgi:hypothetical protein